MAPLFVVLLIFYFAIHNACFQRVNGALVNPAVSSLVIPLATDTLPTNSIAGTCSKRSAFNTCTNQATTTQAACNQLLTSTNPTPDGPFYACICGSYKSFIACFDICSDDTALTAQKIIYTSTFVAQCSAINDYLNGQAQLNNPTSTTQGFILKKTQAVGPAVLPSPSNQPTNAVSGPGVDQTLASTSYVTPFLLLHIIVTILLRII